MNNVLEKSESSQQNLDAHEEGQTVKQDEEFQQLIKKNSNDSNITHQEIHNEPTDCIDVFKELVKNNNIVPLLAAIDHVDLDQEIEGKPLLSRLCTMSIPLSSYLKNKQIHFKNDSDNRTALHEAIQADDTLSANWCLQKKIANIRDNFGNTPILQAIKLGRRSCFLLCLHYQYYDSEAPHVCAAFNRAWELKVLHKLGYDVISIRDSQNFTPLERAVQSYSYDAAQYLTSLAKSADLQQLRRKTDSEGIINLIVNRLEKQSFMNKTFKPIISPFFHFAVISYYLLTQPFYELYLFPMAILMFTLYFLYLLMFVFGFCRKDKNNQKKDLMQLLKAPQFPILEDICPQCLEFADSTKIHCHSCNQCVKKYHFHEYVCVNEKNEVFWISLQICWLAIVYSCYSIFMSKLQIEDLLIFNFSRTFYFGFAAIIDKLLQQNIILLFWYLYLRIFLLYQCLCLFQILCMMVLNRTYEEINHTEKYKRLYRIVKNSQGSYKNQEIRILQDGFILGFQRALANILFYFVK